MRKIGLLILIVSVILIIFFAIVADRNSAETSDYSDNSLYSEASTQDSLNVSVESDTQSSKSDETTVQQSSSIVIEDSQASDVTSSVSQETSLEDSVNTESGKPNDEELSDVISDEISGDLSYDASDDAFDDNSSDSPSYESSVPPETSSESNDNSSGPDTSLTYAEYISFTPAQQQAYFESFHSIEDYFAWYNAAKKEYDEQQNRVDVSGDVNIGDIIGGN